jgi:hypothetical protein
MADQVQSKSAKGNPASHRMSNKERKIRRQSSWARGEKRKDERRKTQQEAEKRNVLLVDSEKLTPWQEAKAARAARRAKDPRIVRQRRLHMGDALRMPTDAGHRA